MKTIFIYTTGDYPIKLKLASNTLSEYTHPWMRTSQIHSSFWYSCTCSFLCQTHSNNRKNHHRISSFHTHSFQMQSFQRILGKHLHTQKGWVYPRIFLLQNRIVLVSCADNNLMKKVITTHLIIDIKLLWRQNFLFSKVIRKNLWTCWIPFLSAAKSYSNLNLVK